MPRIQCEMGAMILLFHTLASVSMGLLWYEHLILMCMTSIFIF